jgi:hypothetical protein
VIPATFAAASAVATTGNVSVVPSSMSVNAAPQNSPLLAAGSPIPKITMNWATKEQDDRNVHEDRL